MAKKTELSNLQAGVKEEGLGGTRRGLVGFLVHRLLIVLTTLMTLKQFVHFFFFFLTHRADASKQKSNFLLY